MADMIARLKVDSSEYDAKIQRAARGIQNLARTCHEAGGVLNVLEDENREYIQSLGSMQTVAQTTRGKIAELTSAFIDIKSVYNSLSEEEKNGEFGRELNRQLDIMKGRIQEGKNELSGINNEINGGGGLTDSLDALAGKFGLSIKSLTGWGAAIGAGTAALKVAKDVFNDSESNIDEWGRTVKSSEAAYDVFIKTLNNGNWSNFFDNLNTAIKGARDLYDALDRLGSVKSNNEAAIAITQQSIAQLRLRKQQGENVYKQLKEATDRLAALQRQGVEAGKTAGRTLIGETLKNTYNTQQGAGQLGQRTVDRVTTELLNGGQKVFDSYKKIYENLAKKAEDTRIVSMGTTSAGTSAGSYEQRYVNLEKLTNDERKQYLLAKSVTESETQLQQGIHAYAQAVSEATSSAREEFKGNRYALQGGGSGGGKGGTTITPLPVAGSIDEQTAKVQDLQKAWRAAADDDSRQKIKKEIEEQQYILDRMTGKEIPANSLADLNQQLAELRKQQSLVTSTEEWEKYSQKISELTIKVKELKGELKMEGVSISDMMNGKLPTRESIIKKGQQRIGNFKLPENKENTDTTKSLQTLTGGMSQLVSGIQQMGITIPSEIQSVIGVLQGITTILTAIQTINSIKFFAAGGVVHAASGYIVPGHSFSGDNVPAMLNSGETVLAVGQSDRVASSLLHAMTLVDKIESLSLRNTQFELNDGGIGSLLMSGESHDGSGGKSYVSGQNIYLGTNNYLKGSGQGQLVTTRMLRQYGLIS